MGCVLPCWHMHSYCSSAVCPQVHKQQCCSAHNRQLQMRVHTSHSRQSYCCAAPAPSHASNSSRLRISRPTASPGTKAPEMCVIVDEDNKVVGSATRKETVSKRRLGRGSYVLLFNSSGQLFVSRRSLSKDCYPGCLDVTISGVVNWGEEYIDTAVRELQEEVSILQQQSTTLLQQLFIFPYQDSVCHVFGCAFRLQWDGAVAFADAEVEWGRFVPLEELQQQLHEQPEQFTPVGRHIMELYLSWQQQQQQGQQQQQPGQHQRPEQQGQQQQLLQHK